MKKDNVYKIILLTWWTLLSLISYELSKPLIDAYFTSLSTFLVVFISILFILFFWLNSVKDLAYVYYFFKRNKRLFTKPQKYPGKPLVELIYYTNNDFNYKTFQESIKQTYPNTRAVILDDSTNKKFQAKVNYHAKKVGATLVRRESRVGLKAGSLNEYLKKSRANFFVLLDSHGIIPADFVTKALPYFRSKKIGVLQANHIILNTRNDVLDNFFKGIVSHGNIHQSIKSKYGFLPFASHGVMVRKKAYKKVGSFTYLDNEDICFSVDLRNKGFFVKFAPEVMYYEFTGKGIKKNNCGWTLTNAMFMLYYAKKIMNSKMKWYEKLDIFLFMNKLPFSMSYTGYLLAFISMQLMMTIPLHYTFKMQLPALIFMYIPIFAYSSYMIREHRVQIAYEWNYFLKRSRKAYRSYEQGAFALYHEVTEVIPAQKFYRKLLASR